MGLLDEVAGAALGALGLGQGESWRTRLAEAAYTSPSGRRMTFAWSRASRRRRARADEREFAGVDGTYVRDLGRSGRRFPVVAIFHGPDCDLAASAFEELLDETGVGRLEHPVYGEHDVVPVGDIERVDDAVEAAGQATVSVEFVRTLRGAYPTPGASEEADLLGAFDAFQAASAGRFGALAGLAKGVGALKQAVADYRKTLKAVRRSLNAVADRQAAVKRNFDSVYRDLSNGLETLVIAPLALARSSQQLAQYPATLLGRLENRLADVPALTAAVLAGYVDLFGGASASSRSPAAGAAGVRGVTARDVASYAMAELCVTSGVAATAVALVSAAAQGGYATRAQAVEAALALEDLHEQVTAWTEAEAGAIAAAEPSAELPAPPPVDAEAPAALAELVRASSALLIRRSTSIAATRVTTLDRDRTILDLCAELHGDVSEEHLDRLINLNALTGDEIILLPAGRRISWLA